MKNKPGAGRGVIQRRLCPDNRRFSHQELEKESKPLNSVVCRAFPIDITMLIPYLSEAQSNG